MRHRKVSGMESLMQTEIRKLCGCFYRADFTLSILWWPLPTERTLLIQYFVAVSTEQTLLYQHFGERSLQSGLYSFNTLWLLSTEQTLLTLNSFNTLVTVVLQADFTHPTLWRHLSTKNDRIKSGASLSAATPALEALSVSSWSCLACRSPEVKLGMQVAQFCQLQWQFLSCYQL